ncbi:lysozyme [Novosphingobium sp. AP12]|uniref:lysozyme n=1 Tax=Novosphingobium sp. AP12 TaxID=1144305 RepID=UPI0002721A2D|nr:lysozyme [Novosphingobium sp. AP12]EJL23691.1 phage-related lysozyme (muraminidase) [Novosphingobium sp. AP12]
MQLGPKGEALIKKWEGYSKDLGDGRVQAYPDPATGGAPWTIGWGSTGADIRKGTIWTREKAQARFTAHVGEFAAQVSKLLATTPTTQNQFDAMVSLAYNVGATNFAASTLLRKHRARDYAGAAGEFSRWNKAAGRVMAGLTKRRADEAKLYGTKS